MAAPMCAKSTMLNQHTMPNQHTEPTRQKQVELPDVNWALLMSDHWQHKKGKGPEKAAWAANLPMKGCAHSAHELMYLSTATFLWKGKSNLDTMNCNTTGNTRAATRTQSKKPVMHMQTTLCSTNMQNITSPTAESKFKNPMSADRHTTRERIMYGMSIGSILIIIWAMVPTWQADEHNDGSNTSHDMRAEHPTDQHNMVVAASDNKFRVRRGAKCGNYYNVTELLGAQRMRATHIPAWTLYRLIDDIKHNPNRATRAKKQQQLPQTT